MTHFVQSQRDDRNVDRDVSRDDLPQSALVKHDIVLNAESIINISRRRLCAQASPETREAWSAVVAKLREIGEKELADACVPECVYRGFCPEFKSCGLAYSSRFQSLVDHYRKPSAANFSPAPSVPAQHQSHVIGDTIADQSTPQTN